MAPGRYLRRGRVSRGTKRRRLLNQRGCAFHAGTKSAARRAQPSEERDHHPDRPPVAVRGAGPWPQLAAGCRLPSLRMRTAGSSRQSGQARVGTAHALLRPRPRAALRARDLCAADAAGAGPARRSRGGRWGDLAPPRSLRRPGEPWAASAGPCHNELRCLRPLAGSCWRRPASGATGGEALSGAFAAGGERGCSAAWPGLRGPRPEPARGPLKLQRSSSRPGPLAKVGAELRVGAPLEDAPQSLGPLSCILILW